MKPNSMSVNRSRDAVHPDLNSQFHAATGNKVDKPVKPTVESMQSDAAEMPNIPAQSNAADGGSADAV